MKQYLVLLLGILCSCENSKPKASPNAVHAHSGIITQPVIKEFFINSLNIGRHAFNKIELSRYKTATDSNYVVIKFYTKQGKSWKLRNEFHFEKDEIADCDTKLSDFNNDGFGDMTYVSAIAARGANELRHLFIYDKKMDRLVFMKNSEQYPNMLYNKKLNCIDAFLVYGGCSTVFLKIDADSLKEFANVELFHGLTVTVYDSKGKPTIILKDTRNKGNTIRYKNYKPLEENND